MCWVFLGVLVRFVAFLGNPQPWGHQTWGPPNAGLSGPSGPLVWTGLGQAPHGRRLTTRLGQHGSRAAFLDPGEEQKCTRHEEARQVNQRGWAWGKALGWTLWPTAACMPCANAFCQKKPLGRNHHLCQGFPEMLTRVKFGGSKEHTTESCHLVESGRPALTSANSSVLWKITPKGGVSHIKEISRATLNVTDGPCGDEDSTQKIQL